MNDYNKFNIRNKIHNFDLDPLISIIN